MEDTLVASVPSVDAELIQKAEEKKALEAAIRLLESGWLTDVQKKRFCLHFFQGLSTRQIGKAGGHQSENSMGKPDVGREKTEKNL